MTFLHEIKFFRSLCLKGTFSGVIFFSGGNLLFSIAFWKTFGITAAEYMNKTATLLHILKQPLLI